MAHQRHAPRQNFEIKSIVPMQLRYAINSIGGWKSALGADFSSSVRNCPVTRAGLSAIIGIFQLKKRTARDWFCKRQKGNSYATGYHILRLTVAKNTRRKGAY